MARITENTLLDALRSAMMATEPDASDALFAQELADMTGKNVSTVRKQIRVLLGTGGVECVRKPMTRIDGSILMASAYRLKAVE